MGIREIVQAITVTAELTQTVLSGPAIALMAKDLMAAYPEEAILRALDRCRRELQRGLTPAAVIERIAQNDGRPGAEEAWAMCPKSEQDSVCWTLEMREAFSVARQVAAEGDKIGARMAFKETYERLVRESREHRMATVWELSLGWDANGREKAVQRAVDVKLLSANSAQALLPAPAGGPIANLLSGGSLMLEGPDVSPEEVEKIRERFAGLRSILSGARDRREAARVKKAKQEAEDLVLRKEAVQRAVAEHLAKTGGA